MPEQTERLISSKKRNTFEQRTNPGSRKFYQRSRWKKFRARQKKMHRARDEKRVHDLYQQFEKAAFSSYQRWLKGNNPLCVDCIDEGYIRAGNVADHIQRIRAGGDPYNPSNIAFRCHHHHNIKSGKEAHEAQ